MALHTNGTTYRRYSMRKETKQALQKLLRLAKGQIPLECRQLIADASFTASNTDVPDFPCPFKETEAAGALKAVEGGIAAAIANLRYGAQTRSITVDLERASCFLFSAYVATVGGYDKSNPKSRTLLKGMHDQWKSALRRNRVNCSNCRYRPPSCSIQSLPPTLSQSV
jgi:hypothetical protein